MIELIKYKGDRINYDRFKIDRNLVHVDAMIPEQKLFIGENSISTKFIPSTDDSKLKNGFPGFIAYKNDYSQFLFTSLLLLGNSYDDAFTTYRKLVDLGYNVAFLNNPELNTSLYDYDWSRLYQLIYYDEHNQLHHFTDEQVQIGMVAIRSYIQEIQENVFAVSYPLAFDKHIMGDKHRKKISIALKQNVEDGKPVGRPKNSRSYNNKSRVVMTIILNESIDFGGKSYDITIMESHNIKKTTYYKYKKELLADREKMSHLSADEFKKYESQNIAKKGLKAD